MRFRLWLFSLVVLTLLAAVPSHVQAAFPGANGKIVFASNRDGDFEIYTMNADGGELTQLTNNSQTDFTPAWSADGTKIAFTSTRDGNEEIYKMDADGSSQTRVTNHIGQDLLPAWSPDGTKIAFTSGRDGGTDLYTMNPNGSGVTRLTSEGANGMYPAWSPDGTRIAFQTSRDDYFEIYTMNPDGTGQTNLTNNPGVHDLDPDWSPGGSKIGFDSGNEIYVMNADGTNPSSLVSGAWACCPAWSPDGTKIAFRSQQDGNDEIYVMNAGGSELTRLTFSGAEDRDPDWQPIPVGGYPHPKGATPLRISLVPAYLKCTAPSRMHGPSLASPSCTPPAQLSSYATVGTSDSNGRPSKSVGSVRMGTVVGDLDTPAEEADIALATSVTDIRNKADLSDYTGELQVTATVRITDRDNGGLSAIDAGTVSDLSFSFTVPCAATPDTTVGSTCAASTTADALVPNTIREGKRAIWELGQAQVADGGEDGVALTTTDNTLFLKQGIFVP